MKRERLIYVLLLVAISVALMQMLRDKSGMLDFDNKKYWIVKTHSEKKYPIIFGGDSRIYRGISPGAFEKEFPEMPGVNLGYSSNGFHSEYMEYMESRLDKTVPNPVLVVGISPHNFSNRGSQSNHYKFERDSRKKEELIQYMYLSEITRSFLPFDMLKMVQDKEEKEDVPNYQLKYHYDGWMESYYIRPDTLRALKSYAATFTNNPINLEGMELFFQQVQKWTEEGITVISFRTPATVGVRLLEDSLSGFSEENFREQFSAAGGDWIEVDRGKYHTYDGSHLDHIDAQEFTRDLAISIRNILEAKEHERTNLP